MNPVPLQAASMATIDGRSITSIPTIACIEWFGEGMAGVPGESGRDSRLALSLVWLCGIQMANYAQYCQLSMARYNSDINFDRYRVSRYRYVKLLVTI